MLYFRELIRDKKDSEFIRGILVLLTGTGMGQILPILVAPILSRLYTPREFGLFGLYSGIIAALTILSNFKFDLAVIVPRSLKTALAMGGVGFGVTIIIFAVAIILEVVVFALGYDKWELIHILPYGLLVAGTNQIVNSHLIRAKRFTLVSKSKVVKSVSVALSAVLLYRVNFLGGGLVVAAFIGAISELIFVTTFNFRTLVRACKVLRRIQMDYYLRVLSNYRKFPLINMPSSLLNSLSLFAPVFCLTFLYSEVESGFFFQVFKLLSLPIGLLAASYGQVFYQKASYMYNDTSDISEFSFKNFKILILIGVLPMLVLFAQGEVILSFILGDAWAISGKIAQMLSIWVVLLMSSSSLSNIPAILNRQEVSFYYNTVAISVRVLSLVAGYLLFEDFMVSVLLFALSNIFLAGAYNYLLLRLAKVNSSVILRTLALFVLIPFGITACVSYVLGWF